jgi:DNA cross-link repair 1A protein
VDNFNCRHPLVTQYFLTHFHADHYGGLTKAFSRGTIYCSPETARLVELRLKVDARNIRQIPFYTPTEVLDAKTGKLVKVTLIRANHCPGSAMMLFELPPSGPTHLHTGDFRYHTKFKHDPILSALAAVPGTEGGAGAGGVGGGGGTDATDGGVEGGGGAVGGGVGAGGGKQGVVGRSRPIDTLFLDTTYCAPQHTFPLQMDAVRFVADMVKSNRFANPHTLFLFGTYTIGKEEVFLTAARELGQKVYVHPAKKRVLECLDWADSDKKLLTTRADESDLHVVPMSCINFKHMATCLSMSKGRRAGGYKTVIGIRPTGWTFSGGAQGRGGRGGGGGGVCVKGAEGVEKALGVSRIYTHTMHIYIYIYMYVYMYICMCVCVCACVCVCECECIHTYVYIGE